MTSFRISFNSIAPPNSSSHFLALRQLKSYLAHQGVAHHFDIRFNLFSTDTPASEIVREISAQRVEMAAFSVYTWNVSHVLEIGTCLHKEKDPVITVAGGPYVTFMADKLAMDGAIDLLVKGAGEEVFSRILTHYFLNGSRDFRHIPNLLYQHNGTLVKTTEDHCFDVGQQHYQLMVEDGDSDIFYYETSRGCPYRCRYCTWSTSNGTIRFYPREKIQADLSAVFSLPHVRHLGLCDSELFINREHGLWVLREIKRLNQRRRREGLPEINLSFEINPQRIDQEIIDELVDLPLGVNFISCGLQTIDEQVNRDHLGRIFDKDIYFRNLTQLFATAQKKGRLEQARKTIFIEIMHGLPGDTYEGFRKTVDYLLTESEISHFISYRLQVLPGSYFWKNAQLYELEYEEAPPHYLVSNSTFSEQDLEQAERLLFFIYLFSMVFKGIMRFVENKVTTNHLRVYEAIMDHLTSHYPELISTLRADYNPSNEDETIIKMVKYQTDRQFVPLKSRITREARDIIRDYADIAPQPDESLRCKRP